MLPKPNHALVGEEKDRYLHQVDHALEVLVDHLAHEQGGGLHLAAIKAFGEQENWNWDRMPKLKSTYQRLSRLARRVRHEYQWFQWITHLKDSAQNRGYFTEVTVNAASGLPWQFDHVNLHHLKRDTAGLLSKLPPYEGLAKNLQLLLVEDHCDPSEVPGQARTIHETAMKRNFLQQLSKATLLEWETGRFSSPPHVKKLLDLGGEALWDIQFLRYSMATGMYQAYLVDLWQDIREPQIIEQANHSGTLTPAFADTLKSFGEDNASWYVIENIDRRFRSLHPIHVSRALIGPFENKYLTKPGSIEPLSVTHELLAQDPHTGLLRFSRQYAYAPNHRVVGDEVEQVLYREDWSDEIIVAPTSIAAHVSQSILGTNVRVLPM